MKNLKVTLEMKEGLGVILSENPLDGVLAKLYFEKLKKEKLFNGDFGMRLPFLEFDEEGFYHVSNPLYKVKGITNVTVFKRFDAKEYETTTGNKLPAGAWNLSSGNYKMHVSSFELSSVEEVVFYCRGDRDTVQDLLKDLRYLGKKTAHGNGKVKNIIVEETEENRSVVFQDRLMRPVPLKSRYLSEVNEKPAARLMPLTHPYWDRGREAMVRIPGTKGKRVLAKGGVLVENPPRAIAEAFGFKKNYKIEISKHGKFEHIEDNKDCKCKMCGRVQEKGYLDPKSILIENNTNDFYKYIQPRSPFLCDYCYYNYKNYAKKMQKNLDRIYGDMSNILITGKSVESKNLYSDDKTDLYDILMDPPKEPFAVIIKELAGTTPVNGTFSFLPTVDTGLICITYGVENLFVQPEKVFSCIEDAEAVFAYAKQNKINLSEDVLFNRSKTEKYALWYTMSMASDEELSEKMSVFFSKYDKGTRFVAKTILKRYRKEKRKEK